MKTQLKSFLFKCFYKIGFYRDFKSFPSPTNFIQRISKQSEAQRNQSIRILLDFLKIVGDLDYYQKLLQYLVPTINYSNAQIEFIKGPGGSESSFSVFRKITTNDTIYFEKVYFNNYPDIDKLLWFQDNIYTIVQSHINIPSIQKVLKGEWVTIIWFEYLELKPLPKEEQLATVTYLQETLKKLSQEIDFSTMNLPSFITDYTLHPFYSKYQFNFPSKTKLALTHGDIHGGNIYANNTLIDWDTFGIYPEGMEEQIIKERRSSR